MSETFETKDRDIVAWLMLYDPDSNPVIEIRKGLRGNPEFWFLFPESAALSQLITEYHSSKEKDFAYFQKKVSRKIEELRRNL